MISIKIQVIIYLANKFISTFELKNYLNGNNRIPITLWNSKKRFLTMNGYLGDIFADVESVLRRIK